MAIFRNLCVRFVPPPVGLETITVWMPVPLYLSGVVILFAFPRSKSGILDLILEKSLVLVQTLINFSVSSFSIQYFTPWRDWTLDVHFFESVLGKNNLALMGGSGA